MIQVFDKKGRLKTIGKGAPNDAEYVLVSHDASIPNARRLQVTSDLTLIDGGDGGDLTIGLASPSTNTVIFRRNFLLMGG